MVIFFFVSILLVCSVDIICVNLSYIPADLENPNSPGNLNRLSSELLEIKLQKENESKTFQIEFSQLRSEIEILKMNMSKLNDKLVQSELNLYSCKNSTSPTPQIAVHKDNHGSGSCKFTFCNILNSKQDTHKKIKVFQEHFITKSRCQNESLQFKLAHNIETKMLSSNYEHCQSSLSSRLNEIKNLNRSIMEEMVLKKSTHQAEISELQLTHNAEIKNVTNNYEFCQSSLSLCANELRKLNTSLDLQKSNPWPNCKIHRTLSVRGSIVSVVELVQGSHEASLNGSRYLNYWTWIRNGCKYAPFVGNGWYDKNCKLVWLYEGDLNTDYKNDRLKLGSQVSDCGELMLSGKTESGVYNIYPDGTTPTTVFCDMDTDGGGWTIILQRGKRGTHRPDFYRNWTQYENGFGDVMAGDYNIGLKNLFALTSFHNQELRIDILDWQGYSAYANYKIFWIDGASEKYKLTVGLFSGNAGDSLEYHNGHKFTTFDQDNDSAPENNCAVERHGAWWYGACLSSNLNGMYYNVETNASESIHWGDWKMNRMSLKSAVMGIRRINFNTIQKCLA